MTYPPVWGPLYHDVLMFFATHFPIEASEAEQKEAADFIRLFFKFVPCPSCSIHAQVYYLNHPPNTKGSAELIQWVVDMHNNINRQTGKKCDWKVVEALQAFKYRYFNNQLLLSQCDRQKQEDGRCTGGHNTIYPKAAAVSYASPAAAKHCTKDDGDDEEKEEEEEQKKEKNRDIRTEPTKTKIVVCPDNSGGLATVLWINIVTSILFLCLMLVGLFLVLRLLERSKK